MPVLTLENFGVSLVVVQDFEGVTPLVIEVPAGETVVRTLTTDVVERLAAQLDSMSSTLKWWSLDEEMATPVQDIVALRAVAPADRTDKQVRLVEDTGAIYRFDAEGTGADDGVNILVPDDVTPPDPGRWYKVEGATQNHEDLTGLLGGGAGDHYHMTSDEYAGVTGVHGGPVTALNPLVTKDTVRPKSTADRVIYVDKATGSDSNGGTSWGDAWENLEKAYLEWLKLDWRHHCWIRFKGAHSIPWWLAMYLQGGDNKFLVLDGGDDLTVLVASATSDGGDPGGLFISNSGLSMTPSEHFGKKIRLGNISGSPGALTGEIRTIIWNDATTFRVSDTNPFSGDPTGYDYEIVRSTSTITCNLTGFTPPEVFYQNVYGQQWAASGFMNLRIQRAHFDGAIPFNAVGGDGKPNIHLASCTFDKPFAGGNLWRHNWVYMQGGFGGLPNVLDPADITGQTVLTNDRCGVGHIGGDATIGFFDVLNEGNGGIAAFVGCAFEQLTPVSTSQWLQIEGSWIKSLQNVDVPVEFNSYALSTRFGGFEFAAAPGMKLQPGIWMDGGGFNLESGVVVQDCPHGVYARRSKLRFDGVGIVDGGGIPGYGVVAKDGTNVWYDPAAVVTLSGAKGDISTGLFPIPGGHAGVLAGTPRRDPLQGTSFEVHARFGSEP